MVIGITFQFLLIRAILSLLRKFGFIHQPSCVGGGTWKVSESVAGGQLEVTTGGAQERLVEPGYGGLSLALSLGQEMGFLGLCI